MLGNHNRARVSDDEFQCQAFVLNRAVLLSRVVLGAGDKTD
jgi:hypothetical protein